MSPEEHSGLDPGGRGPSGESLCSRRALLGACLGGWAAGALGCSQDPVQPSGGESSEERAWELACRYKAVGALRPEVGELTHLGLDGASLWAAGSEGLVLLDPAGAELSRLAAPFPCRAFALDADGTLWLAGGARVARIDRAGGVLSSFEAAGTFVRRVPLLTDIALSGEDLFLADAANRMIHRFARNGDYVGPIGEDATPTGLIAPSPYLSIALDGKGALLVAHLGRRRVERYSFEGALLGSWGRAGIQPGAFSGCCNPVGLHADPSGLVLTAEKGLGRLTWFSAEGQPLSLLGRGAFSPASRNIQVCDQGLARVFAADPAAGLIQRFEAA